MHQYAHIGSGKTIHSSAQLEAFKNDVNKKSKKVIGGKQRIKTLDGYIIPLSIVEGLPYMQLRAPTEDKFKNLPHVILTSDADWDPTILDNEVDIEDNNWIDDEDLEDAFQGTNTVMNSVQHVQVFNQETKRRLYQDSAKICMGTN
jgi:hypothetical protein